MKIKNVKIWYVPDYRQRILKVDCFKFIAQPNRLIDPVFETVILMNSTKAR